MRGDFPTHIVNRVVTNGSTVHSIENRRGGDISDRVAGIVARDLGDWRWESADPKQKIAWYYNLKVLKIVSIGV